ncbi:UNVERIFIED_CONTAM: hypothetical protein K2H54_013208 [Gekko kuhli]
MRPRLEPAVRYHFAAASPSPPFSYVQINPESAWLSRSWALILLLGTKWNTVDFLQFHVSPRKDSQSPLFLVFILRTVLSVHHHRWASLVDTEWSHVLPRWEQLGSPRTAEDGSDRGVSWRSKKQDGGA